MKNKLFLVFAFLGLAFTAQAQTALSQTTLSAAITVNQTVFAVASATGLTGSITQPRNLYIIDPGTIQGEVMQQVAANGTTITVQRTGINKAAHVNGAIVIFANAPNQAQAFRPNSTPRGGCTAANELYTPRIDTATGYEWICSTSTLSWVPGWNNPNPPGVTADQASVAGLMTPASPLFTVTGTNAITGWTLPVGFAGGTFCVFPTGTFTWTTATNIGLAGTAVVGRTLCFTWNWLTTKWYPSYVS